jgi:probable rRNA maturation factor
MPNGTPRHRPAGRGRVAVTIAAPDGGQVLTRGLARWLEQAAPARARGEVTIALVSDGRMRALNRSFRGKDYATDVLSFPAQSRGPNGGTTPGVGSRADVAPYLGDIVIATGVATRQADEAGHALGTELRVLALHGLLHLLGYDHESDDGRMARVEARLRRQGGLKEGLIERRR